MKLRILCIPLLFLPVWAAADSARSLVQEGNAAYEQGKFEDALKAYEKAEKSAPDASEILFNKGAAYYQQKDYDKAMEAFEQAGMKTKDAKLEAKSQFNMGNCTFHKAESLMQEKPEDALKALAKSVRYFQHAAELDPAMHEAKQNVEVTRLAIHTIQEAMKAQEEAAKQQQELKEKLEKLIKDQQQLQTLTQQTAAQRAAAPPAPEPAPAPESSQPEGENTVTLPPTPQESGAEGESFAPPTPAPAIPQPAPASPEDPCKGLADVQQTLKTDAQAISGAMAQYVPPPPQSQNITPPLRPPDPEGEQASPITEAKDHVDQAVHYQDTAEQLLRESKANEAHPQQGVAIEELKKALDLLNNSQDKDQKKQDQKQDQQQDGQQQDKQDQQQSQEGEQQQQPPKDQQQEGEQQQQQAQQEGESQEQQAQQMQQEGESEGEGEGQDETAREILNEEKEHKMMLMQPLGGYKPVDKDW